MGSFDREPTKKDVGDQVRVPGITAVAHCGPVSIGVVTSLHLTLPDGQEIEIPPVEKWDIGSPPLEGTFTFTGRFDPYLEDGLLLHRLPLFGFQRCPRGKKLRCWKKWLKKTCQIIADKNATTIIRGLYRGSSSWKA